jgi:hypothetical protein
LLVFNSDKRPLSSSDKFCSHTYQEVDLEGVDQVFVLFFLSSFVTFITVCDGHYYQPKESQAKVTEHCPVVETRFVSDWVAEAVRSLLKRSEEAPIHDEVPRARIDS